MKKTFTIIIVIAFLLSIACIVYSIASPKIFSKEDAKSKILGINLFMDKQEVEKILGKPTRIEKQFEGAFGADVFNYFYDLSEIRLEPGDGNSYYVASIFTKNPKAVGPRDIRIGDKVESVLIKFPYDKTAIKEKWGDFQILKYVYGRLKTGIYKLEGNNGYIEFDKNDKPIAIRYFFEGYNLSLDIENNKVRSIFVGYHSN